MYISNSMISSTGDSSERLERLRQGLECVDAVLIGAGAGLSTAAGLAYSGERFYRYFSDFSQAYGISNMYAGGFYPYQTREEYWGWWSRHILINRYSAPAGQTYRDLLKLVKGREYFVLTTNVDHQFQLAGFDKQRLFYTQGDYGLWQCAAPCRQVTYGNEAAVRRMTEEQENMRVPACLVPHCPACGAPMAMYLRCDHTFVQDAGWYAAQQRYTEFVRRYAGARLLLLEIGVGMNTPSIIKYPFWQMAANNANAVYACINSTQAYCPQELARQSICLQWDASKALAMLRRG